jgi:glycosyltransferase involved in cell wall biosynthesis
LRILICSSEAPLPPRNGLRLQVSALVQEFRRQHEVRVLAFRTSDQQPPAEAQEMRLVPRGGRVSATSAAKLMERPLREELERFRPDIVHVTSGRLARLGRALPGRPAVLAALDAWHINVAAESDPRLLGAWRNRVRAWAVRRFERSEYGRFDRVVVVSEEDRRALLEVAPALSVEVIPNGVDADAFAWDGTPRDRSLILFTGVMSYTPNVTAAEFLAHEVLPRVRSAVPAARLALVGRDPHASLQTIDAEVPGVEVVGEVPEMGPWLSRAWAYACPMLTGTGIKNKLLEAMANGLPCVATSLALRGISVSPGRDVLTGSTAEELAAQLVRVLRDAALAERVGAAGYDCVRARHTWASVAQQYERLYREIVPGS